MPRPALGTNVNVHKLKTPYRSYKYSATFKEGGTRKKRFFLRKRDAEGFKEEKEEEFAAHGNATMITEAERAVVLETRARLGSAGLGLREAIEMAIGRAETLSKSCTVAELAQKLILEKQQEGASKRYRETVRAVLKRFVSAFGTRGVGGFEVQEITDYLAAMPLSASSINTHRRILVVLFNYGRKMKFCAENPVVDAIQPKMNEVPIGILTVRESRKLLACCSEEILPAVAIGMFAGVRDAEIQRMSWSEVDLEGGFVTVTADAAKSAKRRLIPICPNLASWLEPYALMSGSIMPTNGRELRNVAKVKAGFGSDKLARRAKLPDGSLKPWPRNALRHGFASYHLAHHKDAAALALEMGHQTTNLIFAHYREIVRPKEAATFWQIRPKKGTDIRMMATA